MEAFSDIFIQWAHGVVSHAVSLFSFQKKKPAHVCGGCGDIIIIIIILIIKKIIIIIIIILL